MMSQINSYIKSTHTKKKLGSRSANRLFSFLHGEGILTSLEISDIPSDQINLTPLLLKK
jgi:hypothetical protein